MLRTKLIRRAASCNDLPTTRWRKQPDEPDDTGGNWGDRQRDNERDKPRFEAHLVASVEIAESAYVGFVENVSEAGAFVATQASPNVGAEINLLIALPDLALVRALGTVRWLRPPSKSGPAGIGIRFERLSALDAARIQEFARARRPKLLHAEGERLRSA
jgi:uncharacterized protein (TIGR02266 family)